MMTRAQQKELLASLDELLPLLRQIDWLDAKQKEMVSACLRMADRVCRKNLSAARASDYHEVFEWLRAIVRGTDWVNLPREDQDEARRLMLEILQLEIAALRKEREVKKLIIFLPYKASMWDSLESIWRAAAADKACCETHVIPIPYADRNPDGTAAEWHCEANQFPSDVPVCDWRAYPINRLRDMHPDVIFFHNPYDDCNFVTSVDAQYYSRNLKTCTDNLVYVPYFVTGHTIAPHLCQASGIMNADKVIVENEDIKAAYEQNYPGGNPPEGKFLALGSPKFDRVLSVKREDFVLPDSWKQIIKGKKIILYLTSLTAALENTEYLCRKLRSVLGYFKEHQNEAALWWRPHPLMEATFKAMRPQYYEEYKAIVEQYKKEAWGIYDDTSDLDRAIVCSDAYYGDMSSVVWLYRATGKAVVLQNMKFLPVDQKTDEVPVWAMAYCLYHGDLWFIHGQTSILFRYVVSTGELEFISKLPAELLMNELSMIQMVGYKDKIFLIPFKGRYLWCYSIKENRFHIISYPKEYKALGKLKFCTGIKHGKYIYCVSEYGCSILRIDMEAISASLIYDGTSLLKQYGVTEETYLGNVTLLEDSKMAAVYSGTNIVYVYDFFRNTADFYTIGSGTEKFITIASIGSKVFLQESTENYLWGGDWHDFSTLHRMARNAYSSIRYIDGEVMILDDVNSSAWFIVDDKLNILYQNSSEEKSDASAWRYSYQSMTLKRDENNLYGFDCSSNELIIIHCNEKKIKKRRIFLHKEMLQKLIAEQVRKGEILMEYPDMRFSNMIQVKKRIADQQCCGERIMELLKEG